MTFRHALRVAELVALRWDQIDLKQGLLHLNRSKHGTPGNHPWRGPAIRAQRYTAAIHCIMGVPATRTWPSPFSDNQLESITTT